MTHDELLAAINTVEYPWWMQDALLAVVELHKPENATLQSWFKLFNNKTVIGCRLCNDFYPCPTIQAIEKELN